MFGTFGRRGAFPAGGRARPAPPAAEGVGRSSKLAGAFERIRQLHAERFRQQDDD
jgi:hypothetical protein